ncbi:class I SAM-dependent methyltransferase [Henriciella sp.]|uniref:class I SAM-dependent methyltransferase n=1 Tax=Henriciella sp. TaxID=1968823 RepID=UPI0026139632|nr:class I SAM-dependent methyltransferase [Henriciella sp.]
MSHEDEIRTQQHALWNGISGQAWVDTQALMDEMLAGFETHLTGQVKTIAPRALLDVGCGTGATTLAASQAMPDGHCTGVDISAPMIALARQRAEAEKVTADFIVADAGTRTFRENQFDMIISRFGVMFFADPVAAFDNLRRAARPGAHLHLLAWRAPEETPFMTLARRTAAPLLPGLPTPDPDAPGQFAFADADKVTGILRAAGWQAIGISPLDMDCAFPAGALETFLTRLGPLGQVLPELEASKRTQLIKALLDAFHTYVQDGEVRFTAACWQISAVNA